MKKQVKIAGYVILGIVALGVMISLDGLVHDDVAGDPVERAGTEAAVADAYNQYGLSLTERLETEPIFEDETYILYADRILVKEDYTSQDMSYASGVLESLTTSIPEGVSQYFMGIPERMILEDGYELEKSRYNGFMEGVENSLPETMTYVDVLPTLQTHAGEYIYFRTEDTWTMRGAYYGMTALGEAMGQEVLPLSAYQEHMYRTYQGLDKQDMWMAYDGDAIYEQILAIEDDPFYFYMLEEDANITWKTMPEDVETIPTISKSRSGKSTVIGTDFQWAIVEGNQKESGTTALLLCDTKGQLIVPYLANGYEKVIVIPTEHSDISVVEFLTFFDTYHVTDFIMIQESKAIGDASDSKLLKKFYELTLTP